MQTASRLKARPVERRSLLSLGLFGLCFLLGLYLGQVVSARQAAVVSQELGQYLTGYVELSPGYPLSMGSFLTSFLVYFRYPLLAFLLGFASFGVLLLPVLSVLLAFSFSYSVCCFVAAFGEKGIVLALAVLGLRYALTLPCYTLLAEQSLRSSAELARYTFGQGRRSAAPLYGRGFFTRFFICAAVLAAGALLDVWLTPWLLQLAGGGLS
ncbi:MAG: stage II sporulation protein M [Oscillospiraceae bacterium]